MLPPELIDKLCEGPDRQLDETLKPRLQALKALKDRDTVLTELREIIGDIINYSLASGFVLKVLQSLYVGEGGNIDDVIGKITVTKLAE